MRTKCTLPLVSEKSDESLKPKHFGREIAEDATRRGGLLDAEDSLDRRDQSASRDFLKEVRRWNAESKGDADADESDAPKRQLRWPERTLERDRPRTSIQPDWPMAPSNKEFDKVFNKSEAQPAAEKPSLPEAKTVKSPEPKPKKEDPSEPEVSASSEPSTIDVEATVEGSELQEDPEAGKSKRTRTIAAAFMILAVLAAAIWWMTTGNQSAEDKLFSKYFEPYETVATLNGVAWSAYDREDWTTASSGFEALLLENPDQAEVRLCLAVANLAAGRSASASSILQRLDAQDTEIDESVRWYLALAHTREQNIEAANELLYVLEKEGAYADAASSLLDDLE